MLCQRPSTSLRTNEGCRLAFRIVNGQAAAVSYPQVATVTGAREELTIGYSSLISNDSFHVWNERIKVNLLVFRNGGARTVERNYYGRGLIC
jgi:hypothetical protein